MTLNKGMIALTFFIIAFSLLIAGVFILGSIVNSKEKELQEQSMLVARTVATLPEIEDTLHNENNLSIEAQARRINQTVEQLRTVNSADYIVIMNMDHVRLSHPLTSKLGTVSTTPDEEAAYSEHYYTSKAKGEVGVMVRAFVPIMNTKHQQIGVAVVGYRLPSVLEVLGGMKWEIALALTLSTAFGLWGALILSRRVKKQMLDYEPHEIAKLYTERIETFNAMHEGIIAIDKEFTVTIFNPKARQILGIGEQNLLGKKIYDILPDTRLPEILDFNKPIYNKELHINQHTILSNRVPIEVDGETVGAIAIFQDRTEVKKLAEELTGVKEFVQALRIQNHEHKNKLHTISGLLQLGHHQEAMDYIVEVQTTQEETTNFLNQRIQNQNIAGLVLSKINRGKELGIDVMMDEHSTLERLPEKLDFHDFVVVFGNLVENAFDALQLTSSSSKEIFISIDQNDETLSILVEDNGVGMTDEQIQKIFDNGFTTKNSANHGIGLYLISDILNKTNGSIDITSSLNEGTSILVTFTME
ncbi:sensor histidine kinase [Kurthia gibsonii]|uniref:sensor histidine kinase n=1 Tax=Kurthia gibsonii TaxID=33946 RepID=UPI002DBF9B9C|nr:sensor histidine kinase [Kurthia gibsonii]MEB7771080.1 sensor histidine kinase [Kurthia gibsonii]